MTALGKSKVNCDDVYDSVIALDETRKYSLFELAQCFIDGYDPDKLHAMLSSPDSGIVSDGLFVLGEIGDLAKNYAADVDLLTRSDDPDILREVLQFQSRTKTKNGMEP